MAKKQKVQVASPSESSEKADQVSELGEEGEFEMDEEYGEEE